MGEAEATVGGTGEMQVAQERPGLRPGRLYDWVRNHEDRWLFVILYVGAAVLLSTFVSLFWLVALVAVHFTLEYVAHFQAHRGALRVAAESVWAVKLDIALVLFALALTLYLNVLFGLLGLRSAAQVATGTRIASRLPAWQRGVRSALLTLDDAAQVTRAAASSLKRRHSHGAAAPAAPAPSEPATHVGDGHTGRWGIGDWISLGLAVGCLVLIVGAPWWTGRTPDEVIATLLQELHPFP